MLGKLTALFSSGIDKVIDSAGKAIDANVTSDEERLAKRNELEKLKQDTLNQIEQTSAALEKEYTARHALDMQSDDRLSKRIRPMSLIYLLGIVSVLALTDGNIKIDEYTYQIRSEYVALFESLLLMVFAFYFGSRGVEKVAKIIKSGNSSQ